MAHLRLLPAPDDRDADQEGDADFVFRRIGEAVPLSSPLAPPPSTLTRPLAVSDRFAALFLAHSRGFLAVRTKAAIDAAKHFKLHAAGPSLRDLCLVDVPLPAPPSLLDLSPDSSLLAVALPAHLHFFSLPSLLTNQHLNPSFSSPLPTPLKDFKWLQNAKSYLALSHTASLYHAHLHDPINLFLDAVHALDSSPDTLSFALVTNNNLSIFSHNLEEQLCLPLSFQSSSHPHNTKVDSLRWVRDDALVLAATELNDDGDEEGFLVQVITCGAGATNFFETSCKPVAFSFPYLFEGISDSILPSGSGPYLLTSYLDRWDILLSSNKKNIDQHVVLLKWCSNEDDRRVVSLEFQSDKYTPRIDLQENGDDNTIIGFGVEKVSLFEKITIQVGAETQELAPQYIMVCLTCEGKLVMYHIARASDPSELPQSSIADFDLNVTEENKTATVSKVPTMEPLSVLPDKGEEPKASRDNQSEMISAQVGPTMQPPASSSTAATLTTTVAESNTPSITDSPFKGGFGSFSSQSPGLALSATIAESKAASGTISQNVMTTQPLNLFSTNAAPNSSNQMVSSFKGPFNFATQNVPTTQPLGNLPASRAPGTAATGSMIMSQKTNSFGGAFALGTQNAIAIQPLGTFPAGATPSNTAAESKTPGKASSPSKAAFGSAFGSIGSSIQKEELPTTLPQSMKPFSNASGTVQNEGSLSSSQPLFKPFSGTGLKLGSTGPGSDGSASSRFGEKLPPSLSVGIQSKPNRNIEAIPVSSVSLTAVKEGISMTRSEQAQVKTTPGSSMTTTKGEVEPEKELANDFYSVKHMTKELDSLLLSIEKKVETTSQQLSLVAVDKHFKRLSETSLVSKKKNNVEEQLQMIQELRDKMSQVSSRQVYMEGIVNQSSDSRYWDVWNCQKLAPEFEQKRQSILKANQNLTTQLVELERHFNALEINRFGEVGRAGFNRRNVYCHPGSSRQTQSLHSVYNTLNSQLAAAEQLSECLAKQISMLNLGSPSPFPSKNTGSVKKQLFESIGLSYESESYASPDIARRVIDPNSVKRVSTSVKDGRRSSVGLGKGVELETARRRRESLDKNWATVEPQKTTVKRVDQQLQSVKQKRFSIGSDKKFKTNNELFRKDMESATIGQTSSSSSPVSLFDPSTIKLNTPTLTKGIDKDAPKLTAVPQQSAAFRWAREVSSPFQNLETKTQPSQETETRVVQEQPMFTVPSQSLATGTKDAKRGFVYSDTSTLNAPPMTKSPPNISSVFLNTSTNFEAKGQPSVFSFSGLARENGSPSFSLFNKSAQSTGSGGKFSFQSESIPSFVAPVLSNSGKEARRDEPPMEKSLSEVVPTIAPPKPLSSTFESSAPVSSTSFAVAGSEAGTPSLPKKVQESVSVSSLGFSPPKPIQETAAITSSLLPPKPVQESISVLTSTSSTEKQIEKSVSAPTSVVSPPKVLPDALASSGAASFSSSLTSSQTVATEAPVPQAPSPSSGPVLSSPVQVSMPETSSFSITTPSKEITVSTADKDEDEMEEEAPDSSTDLINLGALGGFGLGSGSTPPPQNQPKPNPFGSNLFSSNSNPTPLPSLTTSPGSLFRPPSLSFPSSQPVQQPSPPANTSPFAGSGFSGFGQPAQIGVGQSAFGKPAQIGAGQQALGSVLGSFGQSRQFGASFGHTGSSPSSFGGGGFSSAAPTSGGFGGFASATTGGGFASAATGGGFASAAIGGGFAGGGFASAATGGGFAGGGFASAAQGSGFAGASSGGGFAALASKSGGGFAAAAPGGGGGFGGTGQGGGFGGGGFGAFGSATQGGGFSAFSGSGPGRPPAELFSQMRK